MPFSCHLDATHRIIYWGQRQVTHNLKDQRENITDGMRLLTELPEKYFGHFKGLMILMMMMILMMIKAAQFSR